MQAGEGAYLQTGYGSFVALRRLIAVASPDSAPMRRLIQEARDRGVLVDATAGRKTRAVLVMDSDHVLLSAETPEQLHAWIKEAKEQG